MTSTFAIEPLVYTAYDKQRQFHKSVRQYDFTYFRAGRNSGKTTAGAVQSIMESLVYQSGKRGMIVAPTYDMVRDATMAEFFRWMPRHFIREHNKQHKQIILSNGSEIVYRSAEIPDNLRGPNRSWAWIDEPRNLPNREAFNIIIAALRPTMKCWLTSTPAGIFHWLYEDFILSPLPNSHVITAKTTDNPYRGEGYEQRMRSQFSTLEAQQELDAQDVSYEGLVFDNFNESQNVSEVAEYDPALGEVSWYVDDGYVYGDGPGYANYHPRVILFAQETAIGGVNIFNERFSCGEADYNTTIDAVLQMPDPEHPYPLPNIAYVDSSAAMFKGALTVRGIANVGATHSVLEGIRNVRRMISDANGVTLLKIHPRCKHTIREMHSYRFDDSAQVAGGERKPLKIDDHSGSCLRYGTHHLRFGA